MKRRISPEHAFGARLALAFHKQALSDESPGFKSSPGAPKPAVSPSSATGGLSAPPKPIAPPRGSPTLQSEVKLRQGGIDEMNAQAARARVNNTVDTMTLNGRLPTESLARNVVAPVSKFVSDASGVTSLTIRNQAARGAAAGTFLNAGAGQVGKWITGPWGSWGKPKPLSQPEQLHYKGLQNRTVNGQQPLTPYEKQLIDKYDQRQRAYKGEQARQQAWDAYSAQGINDYDKLDSAIKETSGLIENFDPGTGVKADIAAGPDGKPVVQVVYKDPLKREQFRRNEQAGDQYANSLAGRAGNIAGTVGNIAADLAPTAMAAQAAAGLTGAALRTVPGGAQVASRAAQLAGKVPQKYWDRATVMTGLPLSSNVGMRALIGTQAAQAAGTAALQTVFGQDTALQNLMPMMATQNALNNVLGPEGAQLVTSFQANRIGPASAVLDVGTPALGAGTAFGPATQQQEMAAANAAVGAAPGVHDAQQALAPNAQPSPVNVDRIPPELQPLAANLNAGRGTGQVGVPGTGRPWEGKEGVLPTTQNADFMNWVQSDKGFKNADGQLNPVEQQATAKAHEAYNKTLQATGSHVKAQEAQSAAKVEAYAKAYEADQRTQYESSQSELHQMLASGTAKPEDVSAQAEKTFKHLVQSDPENAQNATKWAQWASAKQNGEDVPDDPLAMQFEDNARNNFVNQAGAASGAPPSNDPKSFGDWLGGLAQQFDGMPMEAKAAIGLGVPLALLGVFMSMGEGGGMGGLLFAALGLGAAGLGAAGGGLFGQQGQDFAGNVVGALGQATGMIPKELTPEQKAILTSKDPIQMLLSQGGGIMTREEAAKKVEEARANMTQLQRMQSLGGMQSSVFQRMGLTPEEAQQATQNVGALTADYADPNGRINQLIQRGKQHADPNDKSWAGWGADLAARGRNWWTGKDKQGSVDMNIALRIYAQRVASRC
jgi:hypothetical protein